MTMHSACADLSFVSALTVHEYLVRQKLINAGDQIKGVDASGEMLSQ